VSSYTLLAMGLLPTTFFWRMAYTESMFLCVAIVAMVAMGRRWPLPIVAVLVGLATAVRPVGLALLLPMAWHVWNTSASPEGEQSPFAPKTAQKGAVSARVRQFALRLAYAVPLAC